MRIRNGLKNSFCCGFNISNDDVISVLCKDAMLRFVTSSRSENWGVDFRGHV